MLDTHNPLVKLFCHARDLLEEYNGIDISIRILGASKGDNTIRNATHGGTCHVNSWRPKPRKI